MQHIACAFATVVEYHGGVLGQAKGVGHKMWCFLPLLGCIFHASRRIFHFRIFIVLFQRKTGSQSLRCLLSGHLAWTSEQTGP